MRITHDDDKKWDGDVANDYHNTPPSSRLVVTYGWFESHGTKGSDDTINASNHATNNAMTTQPRVTIVT